MNFDKRLRIFRRKVQASGKLEECRNRMHYTKPTTRRRNALNAAKRREWKRLMEDEHIVRRKRLY
mgnify:FL=1